jgi:hypothetical protein
MKALAGGLFLSLLCSAPLAGQEKNRSFERITLALQQPLPIVRGVDPVETPVLKTLGIFTLVQPERPGEMVRVTVPIGELVARAFRGVAAATERRREENARRRVEAALKWFVDQQPSSQR